MSTNPKESAGGEQSESTSDIFRVGYAPVGHASKYENLPGGKARLRVHRSVKGTGVSSVAGPMVQRVKDVVANIKETIGVGSGTTEKTATKEPERAVQLPPTMKAVVFKGSHKVALESVATPSLEDSKGGRMEHACILKVVCSNICGSDLHMYRGRALTPNGLVFGHEVTGEVVECGRDVLYIKPGDLVSVPFPVACGRCTNCKTTKTSACLNTCPEHPGAIYGYAGMGEWRGGQSEYMLVPYADFNLLQFPNKEEAMLRILDLAMLSDIFPTGFYGAKGAGVKTGDTVYIAGAGPVGICCAASCFLLGASKVVVGDPQPDRLVNARKLGCHTIDLSSKRMPLAAQLKELIGASEVDCAIDCVGFECHGDGKSNSKEIPDQVLHDIADVTKYGGGLGIPGVYLPPKFLSGSEAGKFGNITWRFGESWARGHAIGQMGQCPVTNFNTDLMKAILADRVKLADALNVRIIDLEQAEEAYKSFDKGEAFKYVFDPHGILRERLRGTPFVSKAIPYKPKEDITAASSGESTAASESSESSQKSGAEESESTSKPAKEEGSPSSTAKPL